MNQLARSARHLVRNLHLSGRIAVRVGHYRGVIDDLAVDSFPGDLDGGIGREAGDRVVHVRARRARGRIDGAEHRARPQSQHQGTGRVARNDPVRIVRWHANAVQETTRHGIARARIRTGVQRDRAGHMRRGETRSGVVVGVAGRGGGADARTRRHVIGPAREVVRRVEIVRTVTLGRGATGRLVECDSAGPAIEVVHTRNRNKFRIGVHGSGPARIAIRGDDRQPAIYNRTNRFMTGIRHSGTAWSRGDRPGQAHVDDIDSVHSLVGLHPAQAAQNLGE